MQMEGLEKLGEEGSGQASDSGVTEAGLSRAKCGAGFTGASCDLYGHTGTCAPKRAPDLRFNAVQFSSGILNNFTFEFGVCRWRLTGPQSMAWGVEYQLGWFRPSSFLPPQDRCPAAHAPEGAGNMPHVPSHRPRPLRRGRSVSAYKYAMPEQAHAK